MVNTEYKIAYSEVLEILKYIPKKINNPKKSVFVVFSSGDVKIRLRRSGVFV